jgi:tRNA dimethylallyltransferase
VEPVVVAVVGPTASGKSDLGVRLARAIGGEIVNADAMQLYRGMDVGTAKLGHAERQGVPHHLLDVLDVRQDASVAAYQRAARRVIDDLLRRGLHAVVVGGSGLYVRAALDRLQIPPTDPAVRRRLELDLARDGSAALHARLAATDPAAAASILPGNGRRVVRALEVGELTGRPFAATLPAPQYLHRSVQVGLAVPRPVLDERIAERVDAMWRHGLVAETRALRQAGLAGGRTASRALGYAQVLRWLAGGCTEQQARDDTVRATRRFARRQESWFRRDARVVWLAHDEPDRAERARELVDAAAGVA